MLLENNSYPWDRRVLHEAKALQQGGYLVSVICPKGDSPELRASSELVEGIKVYRYPNLGQAHGKFGYVAEYVWALLCTVILACFVWVRDGFDVLHSANPPDIFFLLAWPFKLFGKKYVYDEHDLSPELYEAKFGRRGWAHRVLLRLQRESYRAADLVISPNESYREIARERGGVPAARLAVVRNGVDIEEFHRRRPRPELKREFKYLAVYLGVMGKQDGVDRVVHAARHLVYELNRRDVLFVMVGKGECWRALQKLSQDLKVDGIVKFVGRISDDLLLDYLSTADVCLAPDPPDEMNQLSTMTKIMEYMACGNPIVSFDLLETRRSAGEAAVYVEGSDANKFAVALSELLDDPPRRRRMAEIGTDRTIHVVGLNRSRRALLEAYSRLNGEATISSGPERASAASASMKAG